MRRCQSGLAQCILVSARLGRRWPLHRRQSVWPRYFDARSASLRATVPAVAAFQGLALLWGGITAWAPHSAMASWHLRASQAPAAVTLALF